jgi:hypothetical protein
VKRKDIIPGVVYGHDEHREAWGLVPMVILIEPADKRVWKATSHGKTRTFYLSTGLPKRASGWSEQSRGYPMATITSSLDGVSRKQVEAALATATFEQFERASYSRELRVDEAGQVLDSLPGAVQHPSLAESDARLGIARIRVSFGLLLSPMYVHGPYFELMQLRREAEAERIKRDNDDKARSAAARQRRDSYREQFAGLGLRPILDDYGRLGVTVTFSEDDLTWVLWVLDQHRSSAGRRCDDCGRHAFKDGAGAATLRHKADCSAEGDRS